MSFVIEDNVPMKTKRAKGRPIGEFSATLRKLEVGQSFHVSTAQKADLAIRSGVTLAQRATGRKFSVAQENNGWRIWRIS